MKRITLFLVLAPAVLALAACSGGGAPAASKTIKATHTPPSPVSGIKITNGKFHPKNVTVKLGTTLTWTNADDAEQSVTSDAPGVFDSGMLAPDATFQWTFDKEGVFPYHSNGESGSYGSVTVVP